MSFTIDLVTSAAMTISIETKFLSVLAAAEILSLGILKSFRKRVSTAVSTVTSTRLLPLTVVAVTVKTGVSIPGGNGYKFTNFFAIVSESASSASRRPALAAASMFCCSISFR